MIYDAGMLVALAKQGGRAVAHHTRLIARTTPLVPGPVLAQVWRGRPGASWGLSRALARCSIEVGYDEQDHKWIGLMLAAADLPGKKRPDVVDALVVRTAAKRPDAVVLTSDPADLAAYAATLPKARVTIVPV